MASNRQDLRNLGFASILACCFGLGACSTTQSAAPLPIGELETGSVASRGADTKASCGAEIGMKPWMCGDVVATSGAGLDVSEAF